VNATASEGYPLANPAEGLENKYPDCAFLKLHFAGKASIPSAPRIDLASSRDEQFESTVSVQDIHSSAPELLLSIRFGKQCQKVPGGSIWFGLRRVLLSVELSSGVMPIEKQHTFNPLPIQDVSEVDNIFDSEATAGFSASKQGLEIGAKTRSSSKQSTTKTVYTISSGGTEQCPVWRFEQPISDAILYGQLTQVPLGSICFSTSPLKVTGELVIRGQRDIGILEAEGLLANDLGRNKLAILERELFLRFLMKRLSPYISRSEVVHE
jgi:hypothetical protein